MNAIQSLLRAEFYNDVTRNARFFFSDYTKAFNDAIELFISNKFNSSDNQPKSDFQLSQPIRSDLATLIKKSTPTITTIGTTTTRYGTFTQNHINYPADYYEFISAYPLIDGYSDYCKFTNYNELGPLLNNSFRKPTNKKTYLNEDSTGFSIWRGTGGVFTSVDFEYLRKPTDFSIGNESNIIAAGAGVLTNATSYIAIDDSVHNGVTYVGGTQFTTVNTNLTSGTVILASLTSPIDLPEKTHELINKMASEILLKVTSDYPKAQAVQSEVAKG